MVRDGGQVRAQHKKMHFPFENFLGLVFVLIFPFVCIKTNLKRQHKKKKIPSEGKLLWPCTYISICMFFYLCASVIGFSSKDFFSEKIILGPREVQIS